MSQKVDLPDGGLTYRLLKSANLTVEKQQLVQATYCYRLIMINKNITSALHILTEEDLDELRKSKQQ